MTESIWNRLMRAARQGSCAANESIPEGFEARVLHDWSHAAPSPPPRLVIQWLLIGFLLVMLGCIGAAVMVESSLAPDELAANAFHIALP